MPSRPALRTTALTGLATLAAGVLAPLALAPAAHAAGEAYTVTPLFFAVTTASQGVTGDTTCDIAADLYTPVGASATDRRPAVLTTNGFGGSKSDQAGFARAYAAEGYVVLSYSGLGFGGSTCKITLDDRQHDGVAGKQLVDFLGGISGNAFTSLAHTTPVPAPDYVVRDDLAGRPASDGVITANDPRVGMIGGSYGGQIQFAVAGSDPRVDTIIPIITWNDLAYSLAPNNTGLLTDPVSGKPSVSYPLAAPGTEKQGWVSLFFGLGIAGGLSGIQADPTRNVGCPNFSDLACVAKAQLDATGFADQTTYDFARNASVVSYLDTIRIPVFLGQGQSDTLFNLQEATATYRALTARGLPVRMAWKLGGHSGGAAAGEENLSGFDTYLSQQYKAWFDHYLRDSGPTPPNDFLYFRDYVYAATTGTPLEKATAAYGSAPSYPAAAGTPLYLSGTGALVGNPASVTAGTASFAVQPEAPASYTELSALDQSQPVRDTAGTFAAFTTAPLLADADQVGIPTLDVSLSAPSYAATQNGGPAGQLLLFAKVYDLAPDGTVTLAHRLISPVRIGDVTKPVHIELPGVVHRFPAGHRIQVVLASSDAAYKNNSTGGAVQVVNNPAAPNVLRMPFVTGAPLITGELPTPVVPEAPVAVLLPLVALALAGGVVLARRRRGLLTA